MDVLFLGEADALRALDTELGGASGTGGLPLRLGTEQPSRILNPSP